MKYRRKPPHPSVIIVEEARIEPDRTGRCEHASCVSAWFAWYRWSVDIVWSGRRRRAHGLAGSYRCAVDVVEEELDIAKRAS